MTISLQIFRRFIWLVVPSAYLAMATSAAGVNYDESKVPKYALPELLVMQDGTKVTSAEMWRSKRRPEVLKLMAEQMFGKLPRLPYGVVPVPAYAEKSQTTAYYEPGSLEGGRPGSFFANTYDLPSRPKWEMEALTLHEAVPGHHLQLADEYKSPG